MFSSGLLKYSGKYKYLTVLACVLSILSATMSIIPLVYIYQIINIIYIVSLNNNCNIFFIWKVKY